MGRLAHHLVALAACCSLLLWAAPAALAQGSIRSDGEVVEIPLGPPATDATQRLQDPPRAELPLTTVDPATGEHPVYHLRPEPYSEEGALLVTLEDLLDLAVQYNLGLRATEIQVEKGHYAVDQTSYAFDPSVGAAVNYSRRTVGGTRAIQQGGVTTSEGLSAGFDFTLPREYGDSFSASYNLDRSRFSIGGDDVTENPTSFGSGITLNYNRPLLRGAGLFLNRIPRFIASNNLELSYDLLDDNIRLLKKRVMDSFFLAAAAREVIEVRRASLERALAQLERSVERYKVGLAIQAEVLQAENSVLVQRAQLLQSIEDYESLLDSLTPLVGIPTEFDVAVDAETALLALEARRELPEDLWDLVLLHSYDLKSLNTQLANLRLSRESAANQLKPQLDLDLSYGRSGEADQLGSAVGELENESYSVGLTFRTSPGERAARADVAQIELDLVSIDLQIQQLELDLKTQLRDLQRDLSVRALQIELAASNVTVTRETLNIVTERHNVGLATTLEIIEAQEDLLAAELALLQARIEYQQAYRELLLLAGLI